MNGVILQAEMKSFTKPETVVLKQHFERKLLELEEEKKSLQVFSVPLHYIWDLDSRWTFISL
jgi:hypothetical protein